MRITSGGNVGIGTTNPGATRLAVRGSSGGTDAGESLISATLGNDSSMSSALVTIRNAGNRGNIGNADGSSLFRAEFTDATAMIINKDGDVGIGMASPARKLQVEVGSTAEGGQNWSHSNGNVFARLGIVNPGVNNNTEFGARSNNDLVLLANNTEKMRITLDGYLRMASGTGGIQFNADTAAANALDDYEEGTWTGTLKGSISDPSTPVTATGNYTKIGRQVTVSIAFIAVNTTGAAGGVSVAGLPFSAAHINVGSVILEFFDFTSGRTSVACYTNPSGPTTILIESSGDDTPFGGVAHTAGTGRYVYTTLTYFV
jgi:hypothetical protein